MRFSLGNAMRRGVPPSLFRKECASCERGGKYVGVYEKRKSAQENENKGRNVATGMRRMRVVGWVFERKSTVHVRMYHNQYLLSSGIRFSRRPKGCRRAGLRQSQSRGEPPHSKCRRSDLLELRCRAKGRSPQGEKALAAKRKKRGRLNSTSTPVPR
jgi:hypothetical protein